MAAPYSRSISPTRSPGEIDVAAHGSELLIRVRDFQRRISLPASLIGLPLAGVTLEKGSARDHVYAELRGSSNSRVEKPLKLKEILRSGFKRCPTNARSDPVQRLRPPIGFG